MSTEEMKERGILIQIPTCPVCGSTKVRHAFRINTYECADCGYSEQEEESVYNQDKKLIPIWN